ncbi:MAG: alpha/beta hydrolase [Defluviitaleaceae bacterium]|nr:alpha/beta hydrolase [Defluviitaleaceae bacterium]
MKKILVITAIILFFGKDVLANDYYFTEQPLTIGPYYLQGTLTMPYNVENPPVAILVWGTGQVNKDGAYGGIVMLRDLAHGLAKQGIATIRYNKRYYQHPPIPRNMTLQDEILQDVDYAILKAYNNPYLGEIYIIGFSLGGILAPTIAYTNAEKIVGLVSMAGSPRPAQDIIITQRYMIAYIASLQGHEVSPQHVVDAVNFATSLPLFLVPAVMEQLMGNIGIDLYYFGFPLSYILSLATVNNRAVLEQLNIPMLILQGDQDLQISPVYDFEAWKYALYNHDNTRFIMYQGLNHFFTPHLPQHGLFQGRQRANMYEQVIVDIGEWINEISATEF